MQKLYGYSPAATATRQKTAHFTTYDNNQARSEPRFWRGAEVDKVKNPKQLYVISLGKVRKIFSFGKFAGALQAKITIFAKFLAP